MTAKTQYIIVALIRKGNKYLLTKRYDPKRPIVHNTWQLVGGGLRFKESILDCLHREIREEIGHEVNVISFIPHYHEKVIEEENWHGIALGFLCELIDDKKKIKLNVEATEYGWYSLKEALSLPLHHGAEMFLKFAAKIK